MLSSNCNIKGGPVIDDDVDMKYIEWASIQSDVRWCANPSHVLTCGTASGRSNSKTTRIVNGGV